ncbi:transcriptional regulator with XRE-family HTH domain [Arcanobacterium wilhelmae]|uniref:Transcriptional regulator with XRE-family HTH domain n=1 Tax=Arcanobacterium wilhelmae TaxID=1803177 RepID=A0ABT9NCW1_9ACTO|nr:helix-turn-helix transcriptional regulator [Arcanobacterium wilhelmae]MDP9801211.1 transcriptional regulator with XRE-family HTH domain [Arcanobacterium wilhelmae]WFN90561.1 helix-turn-helix transcriptional regulator [Arcanobacterium wilhelmae]
MFVELSKNRRAKIARLRAQNNRARDLVAELVKARKDMKITQIDMAAELEVDQATISRFENFVTYPRLDFLRDYAEAVGKEIQFMVSDAGAQFGTPAPARNRKEIPA